MDHTEYERFDFSSAAQKIRLCGPKRDESPAFADAICAFYFKVKYNEVSVSSLVECLGAPDSTETLSPGSEALEYKWVGFQGIRSSTRFLVIGNRVVGVEVPHAA